MERQLGELTVVGDIGERLIPRDPTRLLPYLAALSAAGIPHRTEVWLDGTCHIVVSEVWAERARRELAAYERDNRGWPHLGRLSVRVKPLGRGALMGTAAAVGALLFFFWRFGPADAAGPAFERGALDCGRVAAGEWWRAVTALTLHADAAHVLANACAAAVFGTALSQLVGAGPAWGVVLLSGVLGNLTEGFTADATRSAIGASTATFGALAALGMLQTVRWWRRWGGVRVVLSRTWIPLGAAAALLGWLGSGPESDLLGHAFGFAWGLLGGAAVVPLLDRHLSWHWHLLLGLLCAGTVAFAWQVAGY